MPESRVIEPVPRLSLAVVFYNMAREAKRTLYTLTSEYQRDVCPTDYEVLVVDNGSTPPLDARWVESLAPNFRYFRFESNPSPVKAINAVLQEGRSPLVGICIDGARMASPRLISYALRAARLYDNPIVAPLAWHLGHEYQPTAVLRGYNRAVEDALLESIPWQTDGYRLFDISTLAGSSADGFFLPIAESNSLILPRSTYWRIGGFDERFDMPGAGMANLDFYARVCALEDAKLIVLLGEGTFHQFHGGVMTNSGEQEAARFRELAEHYVRLRHQPFTRPTNPIEFFGHVPPQMSRFIRLSCDALDRTRGVTQPAPSPKSPRRQGC